MRPFLRATIPQERRLFPPFPWKSGHFTGSPGSGLRFLGFQEPLIASTAMRRRFSSAKINGIQVKNIVLQKNNVWFRKTMFFSEPHILVQKKTAFGWLKTLWFR